MTSPSRISSKQRYLSKVLVSTSLLEMTGVFKEFSVESLERAIDIAWKIKLARPEESSYWLGVRHALMDVKFILKQNNSKWKNYD